MNNSLIDRNEELISFRDAAQLVPPRGVDPATISRWASIGHRGVVLEAVKIGGRRFTSRKALERFLDECNRRGTLGYMSSEMRQRVIAATGQFEGDLGPFAETGNKRQTTHDGKGRTAREKRQPKHKQKRQARRRS
ncbi:MAG: DUF1580 domain-containing protein [Pirellulales bacterium]